MADPGRQLWKACSDGERARAEILLNAGANIEHKGGRHGETPIMVASQNGHLDVVTWLVG